MRISYNWLKWYVPGAPGAEKLVDIFNYHLCEVESLEKIGMGQSEDSIFDLKVLPNRAHDLLSHQGVARELASLLNIKYVDPTLKYKVPESKPTKLIKEIESPGCRRYMGRIIRNVKVGPSPEWVVKHLESIGQRSINNIVDATNIVMYDCGQPAHVFDLSKVKNSKLKVRNAKAGEKITLLDGKEKTLNETMMVIADDLGNPLDIAGVKGGKYAELTDNTTDIILECANFDPVSVRKTAQALNIVTDAKKRFENDLSPERAAYGMLELSALIFEMCPEAIFEEVVDVYPQKQEVKKLSFSLDRISSILGLDVSLGEVEDILKRYNFQYNLVVGVPLGTPTTKFEIVVPPMRLDLVIEEDMAEEIGRILGYNKVKGKIPKIYPADGGVNFVPKVNNTYAKISWARNKLLSEGYSEIMTYVFCDKGDVEVLASASDKKFLMTNLSDGLKESLKLNQLNLPLLDMDDVKIFETGTVFKKDKEQTNVCYGEKKNTTEVSLDDFCKDMPSDFSLSTFNFQLSTGRFTPWSMFPFIARDIALWVPQGVESSKVKKNIQQVIKENAGDMVVKDPELFDEFTKEDRTSYAFRLVFQSYERTLTDAEVNEVMEKIKQKLEANKDWQVR